MCGTGKMPRAVAGSVASINKVATSEIDSVAIDLIWISSATADLQMFP